MWVMHGNHVSHHQVEINLMGEREINLGGEKIEGRKGKRKEEGKKGKKRKEREEGGEGDRWFPPIYDFPTDIIHRTKN